jgi:glycosyltransferase involved in cell wall biosynthesis
VYAAVFDRYAGGHLLLKEKSNCSVSEQLRGELVMSEKMAAKKVKVLLSSYNGEKYIREQIDSILSQTHKNLELYIRDDGSKDGTVDILKQYKNDSRVHVTAAENAGFAKSFFALLELAGDADYYAFSDQDDVWLPEKISMALEQLEGKAEDRPVLYFSNYDFYDAGMHYLSTHNSKKPRTCFRNSLVDCVPLGFNMVVNRMAREMTVAHMPKMCTGHDWWMYMLCAGLGEIVYDARVTVKYRRHTENVSGAETDFVRFQIWRFRRFFVNGYFKKIQEQIKEFGELYGDRLSAEDQKELAMFTKAGFHPVNNLKKVFYPKYFRQKAVDEIFIRLIFLIGRL